MTIHKEGFSTLFLVGSVLLFINAINVFIIDISFLNYALGFVSILLYLFILRFFRKPKRQALLNEAQILSPADGTVVAIEKTMETEFFKEERLQVSVFMSAWNVHINWYPINGKVKFFRYHPGLYLLARNPKSSSENERTSIVVENIDGKQVMFRQIAGFVARRVVARIKEGDSAKQAEEFGFIKFGSRVDLFLPLDVQIKVEIGQKVVGTRTVIAEF